MMIDRFFLIVLFLFVYGQSFAAQASGLEAGYVQQVNGRSNVFQLKHNGEILTPTLLTPLYAGDTITLLRKGRMNMSLVLYLDHQPKKLISRDFPYTVPAPKGATSIPENIMWMAKGMFASLQTTYTATVSMKARGTWQPPLALPSAMAKSGVMVAGKRGMILQWKESNPPYRIELSRQKKVILTKHSNQPHIQLQRYRFSAGRYQLTIQDAQERSRTTQFTVVQSAPAMPKRLHHELNAASISKELKRTLHMAWLIKQDSQWKLEAYQTLCAKPREYATLVLCHGLVQGKRMGKADAW